MREKILFSLMLLVAGHTFVLAQQNPPPKPTPAERFNGQLFKTLRFPYNFTSSCDAVFTTIVIPVRNSILQDSLIYEAKCPEVIKNAFNKVLPLLREQEWDKILPAVKDKQDYDLILPFAYSFKVDGCWDTIPARTIGWETFFVMEKRKNNPVPSYSLSPLTISRLR